MTAQRITPPSKGNGRRKKAPLPIGRQTSLTPDVQKKIVDAVRAGAFLSVAARYAGVGQSTLMTWMARGRACTSRRSRDAIYLEFLEEVEAAEAASEVAANLQWRAAWAKDWHSAEKWLQSRYPERYGPNRDPNAPIGAFAGVNVTINAPGATNGPNQGQNAPDDANLPLEALIEANPRLLGATMHLFDEIDAIYGERVPDAPQIGSNHDINRFSEPKSVEMDDFDVIEGDFTHIDDQNDV